MNAQCHHCKTVFRVDPRKVPTGGARARCSICRNVFEIRPDGSTAPAPSAGAAASAAASAASAPVAAAPTPPTAAPTPSPTAAPTPTPTAAPAPTPAPPPAPTPTAAPTPAPAATGAAPAAKPNPFSFGANDPGAKARRLARALVSDIVMYHPDRRDQAIAAGTLKREFMDEIKKSWEEYVAQVGNDVARSTPHFRDALNEILAKGQAVF